MKPKLFEIDDEENTETNIKDDENTEAPSLSSVDLNGFCSPSHFFDKVMDLAHGRWSHWKELFRDPR
jgi:hypothetical protein